MLFRQNFHFWKLTFSNESKPDYSLLDQFFKYVFFSTEWIKFHFLAITCKCPSTDEIFRVEACCNNNQNAQSSLVRWGEDLPLENIPVICFTCRKYLQHDLRNKLLNSLLIQQTYTWCFQSIMQRIELLLIDSLYNLQVNYFAAHDTIISSTFCMNLFLVSDIVNKPKLCAFAVLPSWI